MTHLALEDYENALLDSQMAVQLNPDYAEAYLTQSAVYMALGDTQMASRLYAQYMVRIGANLA